MKLSYRIPLLFAVLTILLIVLCVVLYLPLKININLSSLHVISRLEIGITGATGNTSHLPSSVVENNYLGDIPCLDECEWNREQKRRRNTVENACAHYNPEQVTKEVLRHILVSDEHKTLYCYIPKVACTTWKRIILALNHGKDHIADVPRNVHSAFIPSLSIFSPDEAVKRLQNYTKLMIVRNPHERLLSAYIEKFTSTSPYAIPFQRNYGPRIQASNAKYWRKKFHLNYTEKTELDMTSRKNDKVQFQEFIRYIGDADNKLNSAAEEHWREMYRLCSPCSIKYDFIAKLETITEDSKFILSQIGAKNLMSIVQAKPLHATNSSSESKIQKAYEEITEEDVLQFEKRFEKDMALFGYQRPTSITGFKSEDDDRKDALRQLSLDEV
ncbi:carbohydrate sulfotransferase 13-like [Amphiura filiformis]|uniref:carbohydrate sulfotransferase 13-like n=1 Tax=Amphiura filiformis TaxID=82378 RepID=UPI003B20CDAE